MALAPNATFETLLTLAAGGAAPDETLRLPLETTISLEVHQTSISLPPRALDCSAPPGQVPEGYEAHETLGAGAMGTVWLATETALGRDVALKVLNADGSQVAHASLLSEAKVLARLKHAAIPPIYALGKENGSPFMAMRRVEGISVKELAADPAHAQWSEWSMGTGDRHVAIVEILVRVAEALAHAHSQGLVHRDVKPANIVVGSLGQAFLVDWGLAVPIGTAGSSVVAGTPGFMAPEMALGGTIDERTDVYLLGATLHSLLTGRARHAGATVDEVLRAAVLSSPVRYRPEVPSLLAALANAATAREPSHRPSSALEVRDRLRGYRRDRMAEAFVESAGAPLAELERLVGRLELEVAPEVERLASVCRFVYRQAAELGTTASLGQIGLQRVARALARFYLARGEAGPARAAIAEVEGPERDALDRAMADLEREREHEAQRVAGLKRALKQYDPAIEARGRSWLTVGFGVTAGAAIIAQWLLGAKDESQASIDEGLRVAWVMAAVIVLVLLYFARRIVTSRPNRLFATVVMLVALGRLAFRLMDRAQGAETFAPAFARELVFYTCLSVLGGVATKLGVWWYMAAVFTLGAVACAMFPSSTMPIFETAVTVGLFGAAAVSIWWRRLPPRMQ